MTTLTAQCGTPAGAQAHRRRGEEACFKCKLAEADAARQYRKTPAGRATLARQQDAARARYKALRELAKRHPDEYENLLGIERLRNAESRRTA